MKEIIDKLIKSFKELPSYYSVDNGRMISLEDTIGITKALAEEYKLFGNSEQVKVSEMPTGWIPCSERLPRYEEDVLLYLSSYEIQMGYKVIETGGDCFYTYISQEFVDMEDVIAWQPLPAPYTEGE